MFYIFGRYVLLNLILNKIILCAKIVKKDVARRNLVVN